MKIIMDNGNKKDTVLLKATLCVSTFGCLITVMLKLGHLKFFISILITIHFIKCNIFSVCELLISCNYQFLQGCLLQ
jgi:hypothetical protein